MSACTLDTDVVIAALDRADSHHEAARIALIGLIDAGTDLYMSTINYAEALVRPASDRSALETAVQAISQLGVEVVAPQNAVAVAAARYRGGGVSLADGFALATAGSLGSGIGSFDRRVQRAARALDIDVAIG